MSNVKTKFHAFTKSESHGFNVYSLHGGWTYPALCQYQNSVLTDFLILSNSVFADERLPNFVIKYSARCVNNLKMCLLMFERLPSSVSTYKSLLSVGEKELRYRYYTYDCYMIVC